VQLIKEKDTIIASTSRAEYQTFELKQQALKRSRAPGADPIDQGAELEKWGKKFRESLARVRGFARHFISMLYKTVSVEDLPLRGQ